MDLTWIFFLDLVKALVPIEGLKIIQMQCDQMLM